MGFAVVGVSRTEMSHDEFRKRLRIALEEQRPGRVSDDVWNSFCGNVFYLPGDSKDPQTYRELKGFLRDLDASRGTRGNRAFYLVSSPSLVSPIVERLGEAGVNEGENGGWARVVGGKPFGGGLAGARELNRGLRRYFRERPIHPEEHYLGTGTGQNI